jgi:hypothetical protein
LVYITIFYFRFSQVFWHSFWHIYIYLIFYFCYFIRHSFWYIFENSLYSRSGGKYFEPNNRVRRGILWSNSWGPAVNILIRNLLFRSGGKYCDLVLVIEVRGNLSDNEFVVRVQRGLLRFSNWDPTGIILILNLLFGSSKKYYDLVLAIEIR